MKRPWKQSEGPGGKRPLWQNLLIHGVGCMLIVLLLYPFVGIWISVAISIIIGVVKGVFDKYDGRFIDVVDIIANFIGTAIGAAVAYVIEVNV